MSMTPSCLESQCVGVKGMSPPVCKSYDADVCDSPSVERESRGSNGHLEGKMSILTFERGIEFESMFTK